MKQKVAALLVFLFLPSLVAGLSIKELTASPSTVQEATAVSFNAIIGKTGGENYSLEWDFGDGIVSSSPHSHSMHSFYIEGLGKEQEFTVTLRTKNSGTVLAEKSVKVKVKRSDFKPALLELLQFPKGAEEKNGIHTITIHFLDAFGQSGEIRQENGSLKFVSFSGASQPLTVSASLKGKEVKLVPYKGENVARKGALVGSFKSDESFNCIELLEINAKIAGVEKHFSIPLFFKPLEIELKDHSTPVLFPGKPLGKTSFLFTLKDKTQPQKGSFSVQVFAGKTLKESKQLSFNGTSWSAFLDYTPTEQDIIQGLKLVVTGSDSHGNILGRIDSSGSVLENGMQVMLSQGSKNPLKIEVVAPTSKELGFGEKVDFTAKLVTENNGTPKNARVILENTSLGLKKELEWNGEFFETTFKMPEKASSTQKFLIHAYARVSGRDLYNYAVLTISLSKRAEIKFNYPKKGITELDSNNPMIKVKLLYPDGSSITEPKVPALLSLDGREETVMLTLNPKKQEYQAKLPQLNPGKHTLSLKLKEPFEGVATISTTLVKPVWPLVLGAVLVIIIIAFLVFLAVSIRKAKKMEKTALQSRLAGIEKQLKAAKVEYFKRKLTDEQYRERVLKLQQEKEQILKKKIKTD